MLGTILYRHSIVEAAKVCSRQTRWEGDQKTTKYNEAVVVCCTADARNGSGVKCSAFILLLADRAVIMHASIL